MEKYKVTPTGLELISTTAKDRPISSRVTDEQWAAAIERGKQELEQEKSEAQKTRPAVAAGTQPNSTAAKTHPLPQRNTADGGSPGLQAGGSRLKTGL
jgi:hypothetical protein